MNKSEPPVAPDDTPTRLQQIRSWVDQNRPYPAFMSSIAGDAAMFLLQQLDELRAEVSRLREALEKKEKLIGAFEADLLIREATNDASKRR